MLTLDVFQNYEIQADKRDAQAVFAVINSWQSNNSNGGKAVHQWKLLVFVKNCLFTERFFERCLLLPMNTFPQKQMWIIYAISSKSFIAVN